MKEVIQRVSHASVKVGGKTVGSCKNGFLILLGVMAGDEEKEADKLVNKTVHLRIFEDENGKMNLSALDTGAEMLVVSQLRCARTARTAGGRVLRRPPRRRRQKNSMNILFPN